MALFLLETPGGMSFRCRGKVDGLGTSHCRLAVRTENQEFSTSIPEPVNHLDALGLLVDRLNELFPGWQPAAIGHRVVHGGIKYHEPTEITAEVRQELEELIPLAPLHEPANIEGIDAATKAFPGVRQVACFDTAFHADRSYASMAYALPRSFFDQGIRRYGFHGLSYEYICARMRAVAPAVVDGRMIVCHLGNGASLAAIQHGRCVETTMGFTPTDGMPMGTRCGQIDPGVVLHLMEHHHWQVAQVAELLTKKSGLLGVSGLSSDMRELIGSSESEAADAVDIFVYRLTYFIGALTACLGGLDGLVFTGGIGENSAEIRGRVCQNLTWLGLNYDLRRNVNHEEKISADDSRVSVWVIPTDEERLIAEHLLARFVYPTAGLPG